MSAVKKYDGSTWQPITPKKLKGIPYTGTLPATLTGTKAGYLHRYKIYGNTEQTGTPTPSDPIEPSECGELETTGVHAGQYKLPLSSAGQSVDIYLGESQTTRRIRKLMLTGNESYTYQSQYSRYTFTIRDAFAEGVRTTQCFCTHYQSVHSGEPIEDVPDKAIYINNQVTGTQFCIKDETITSLSDFKAYLAQQYANGTPVTIWYVLATEETGTLNEPLRKIGDYTDTIDSTQTTAQIPTTAGSMTISWAGEGLAPSQFDSIQEWVDIPTYTYTNGEWVADNSN